MTNHPRSLRARGPEHERVVAVLNGRTGSGYALTPRLVLTAAHVLDDRVPLRATAVRGTGSQHCRVVWRSEQRDAALLAADRDLVGPEVASRLNPVHWATLSDVSPIGDCQVMGFPRFGSRAGDLLDTEHIECALRPGSGIVRNRYLLDVKDLSPELAAGASPWEGMSGAALFAQGHLLGVVVAAPQNWQHRRLEAIKSRALLDDPQFVEVLTRYDAAPVVTELSAATRLRTPLMLAGVPHSTPRDLAATIRTAWTKARRQFFETMGTSERPSEGWRNLLGWLRQFDEPSTDDVEGRLELIDQWLTNPHVSPDLKLLHLLRWLDPEGAPVWRGTALTMDVVAEACLAGRLEDEGPAAGLYRDLCAGGLLDALSGFTELRALHRTQEAWDAAWEEWCRLIARSGTILPGEVREWAQGPARGMLLGAVLPDPATQGAIRTLAERIHPPATGVVGWYDWMTGRVDDPDTPVGKLLRTDIAELAVADVAELARERSKWLAGEVATAAAAQHDREWAAYELRRCSFAARLGAVLRAAIWIGQWCAALIGVTWLMWGLFDSAVARTASWQLGAFALAAFLGRLPGVLRLGGAYRPPLLVFTAIRRRTRTGVAGLVRIGGLVVVPSIIGVLAHDLGPFLTVLYVALVMIWLFTMVRGGGMHDWDEQHQERRRDYEAKKRTPLDGIAQSARSGSARERADAYSAWSKLMGQVDPSGMPSRREPGE